MERVTWYAERILTAWREQMPLPLLFFFILLVISLVVRGRKSWTKRASVGVIATLVLVTLNLIIGPFEGVAESVLKEGYENFKLPQTSKAWWDRFPAWLLVVFAIVTKDFADYWSHRFLHHKLLWPVHSIHHSDPDVNPLTTFRVHEIEGLVMNVSYLLLLTWLNLPPEAIGIVGTVLLFHNMYVHTNVDWGHGPLRLLIASPRYHRWHHADIPEAHGKNLANVIPLFDVVFGTYYCPGPCDAPLGAEGVPEHNPFKLALFPFVLWMRDLREFVGRGVAGVKGVFGRGEASG
ncbi:MAG: sterol desaturase family protein [Planctomycetes bacterium]|nr:sterol desaturase family protein [Planctomycetota bacterium]